MSYVPRDEEELEEPEVQTTGGGEMPKRRTQAEWVGGNEGRDTMRSILAVGHTMARWITTETMVRCERAEDAVRKGGVTAKDRDSHRYDDGPSRCIAAGVFVRRAIHMGWTLWSGTLRMMAELALQRLG